MFKKLLHALGRSFISLFLGVDDPPKITDKQCIVAANHNSHADVMILFRLFAVSRTDKVKTIAAKSYFGKGFKGYVARILFNSILLDRRAPGKEAFEILKKELDDGCSLIIFPEGTRGKPGLMNEFKMGIGQIAVDFPDIPIYPVCLSGTEKAFPKGTWMPVPFSIKMKLFEPIYGRDYIAFGRKESRKKVTLELEQRIRYGLDNS